MNVVSGQHSYEGDEGDESEKKLGQNHLKARGGRNRFCTVPIFDSRYLIRSHLNQNTSNGIKYHCNQIPTIKKQTRPESTALQRYDDCRADPI